MLWKKKVLILFLWLAATLVAMYEIRQIPPTYRAEAAILVDQQKIPQSLVATTVNTDVRQRLSYISEQILSSRRLTAVLTDFDLFPGEQWQRTPEEYAERIRRDISVSIDRPGPRARPGVIRLGFRGPNRNVVASVANRLANLLIEENLKTREVMAEGTAEFIDSQLQEAKKVLDDQEAALSRYKVQFNGELPQQEQQLGATLGRLQGAMEASRDAVNRSNQNIVNLEHDIRLAEEEEKLQEQASEIRATAVANTSKRTLPPAMREKGTPVVQPKQSEVIAGQLRNLRAKYGDGHPDIRRLQAVLDQTLRQEAAEPNPPTSEPVAAARDGVAELAPVSADTVGAANAELAKLNADALRNRRQDRIAGMRAQIERNRQEIEKGKHEQEEITKNISAYQQRLERLPIREQQMAQVTRDHAAAARTYQVLLEKKGSAEIATELERRQKAERFTLIEPARVPDAPVSPNRPLLNAVSTAVALLLGAVIGLLLELRKGKLLGEWELPPDVVVLAHLPRIQITNRAGWTSIFRRGWRSSSAAATGLMLAIWMRLS